jgi:hypothetical protein
MRSEGSSRLRRISRRELHMRVVCVKRALHCLTKICSRRLIGLRASHFNCSSLM